MECGLPGAEDSAALVGQKLERDSPPSRVQELTAAMPAAAAAAAAAAPARREQPNLDLKQQVFDCASHAQCTFLTRELRGKLRRFARVERTGPAGRILEYKLRTKKQMMRGAGDLTLQPPTRAPAQITAVLSINLELINHQGQNSDWISSNG